MQVCDVFEIIQSMKFKAKKESLSLKNALNRVLADDIYATKDLPAFDNSALDGYAFDFEDINLPLKVAGTIFAGDTKNYKLKKQTCYKIMTGAAFASGANTVVAIEDAKFDENGALLAPKETKKDNARKIKGEEIKCGELILKAGTTLRACEIMLLASQGINKIKVYKKPKIALLSSGSEIKEPWQKASTKQIYNANASGILALLDDFEVDYFGIIKDNKKELLKNLKKALKYDIIITTGGASKGDADYMTKCLEKLDFKALFSSINFRPAKPTKLYKSAKNLAIVLPGNPLSCFIACYLFALPILKKAMGCENALNPSFEASFKGQIKLNAIRDNLVIGRYENGEFEAFNGGKFSPSQISPLTKNNAFTIVSAGVSELKEKSLIKIYKIY